MAVENLVMLDFCRLRKINLWFTEFIFSCYISYFYIAIKNTKTKMTYGQVYLGLWLKRNRVLHDGESWWQDQEADNCISFTSMKKRESEPIVGHLNLLPVSYFLQQGCISYTPGNSHQLRTKRSNAWAYREHVFQLSHRSTQLLPTT